MKNTLITLSKLIFTHIFFLLLGTIIFVLLFHTKLFAVSDIFFYRGIFLLLTTCTIIFISLLLFKRFVHNSFFTYKDVLLSIVILFSLNMVLFTHIPVTEDRSLSIFILKYMDKYAHKSFTNQEIEQAITEKYLREYGGVSKRFHEQEITGDIKKTGSRYRITEQGQLLVKFYSVIAGLFNINGVSISR